MKYASVYPRKGSPRFRISYWCPVKQTRVHETTPFRTDDPQGRRKALARAYELSKSARADKEVGGADRWERWVADFLNERHHGPGQQKTLKRYLGAWAQWSAFFAEESVRVPRAVDYNLVLKFIAWRRAQIKPSKKHVSKNSALCDVRTLSIIMREAMRRGFAEVNHCEKLGILKDPAKEKPEITDLEVGKIRTALASRPEWMRISFEIALHQGCRLSETSAPMTAVDIARRTITFSAKGRGEGRKHVFTTQLHPALVPLMTRLQAEKRERTCVLPQMAAKEWWSFFNEIGLGHLCFHCTRVTVITRMARAGVPISQAMAFVGHASQTIHRIYQRLATGDLGRAVAALSYAGGDSPQTPGGP